jgi:GDSL-like lipase/acylhydrolase family protein
MSGRPTRNCDSRELRLNSACDWPVRDRWLDRQLNSRHELFCGQPWEQLLCNSISKLMRLRQFWAPIAATLLVAAGAYFVLAMTRPVTPSGLTYMPLGDSITQASYYSRGGYRCPLQAKLVNAGYNASAVGLSGFLDRWQVTHCPDNWEGHGSYTTAQIQAWFDADNSMTQLKPDIILALVGTVDVRRGYISQGPNDLRNMLTDIFTQSPNSWVVVSTIPPLGSQVQFFDQVPAYNAAIMSVAAEFPRVSTVDFYTACNDIINQCLGVDGIHPNQAGFDALTPLWFQAIQSIAAGTAEIDRPK